MKIAIEDLKVMKPFHLIKGSAKALSKESNLAVWTPARKNIAAVLHSNDILFLLDEPDHVFAHDKPWWRLHVIVANAPEPQVGYVFYSRDYVKSEPSLFQSVTENGDDEEDWAS